MKDLIICIIAIASGPLLALYFATMTAPWPSSLSLIAFFYVAGVGLAYWFLSLLALFTYRGQK